MGFKERIAGFVPEDKKPPLEPSSFPEFTRMLEEQSAGSVTASPSKERVDETYDGGTTRWNYNVVFESESSKGRKITFKYDFMRGTTQDPDQRNRWGGKTGGANLQEQIGHVKMVTAFATAEHLLGQISDQIADCEVVLLNNGTPFTEEDYDDLHQEIDERNIQPILPNTK